MRKFCLTCSHSCSAHFQELLFAKINSDLLVQIQRFAFDAYFSQWMPNIEPIWKINLCSTYSIFFPIAANIKRQFINSFCAKLYPNIPRPALNWNREVNFLYVCIIYRATSYILTTAWRLDCSRKYKISHHLRLLRNGKVKKQKVYSAKILFENYILSSNFRHHPFFAFDLDNCQIKIVNWGSSSSITAGHVEMANLIYHLIDDE